jgi:predicted component of type VI protein secretion system
MALDLHIAGPGLDVSRRLEPGEPALVLGRDADCSVCLPDPERSVSRRHLSVWNEDDLLHFHVLSVVNGVEVAAGELPPGARGVLAAGESLTLSAFRVSVAAVTVAPPALVAVQEPTVPDTDPWDAFEREAAQLVASATQALPAAPSEDDPFGDWGFQSTFGPGSPGGPLRAEALAPAVDLGPFFAGLGLARAAPQVLTQGELEAIGRIVRAAVQALLQVGQAAGPGGRGPAPAGDLTALAPREPNPLRMDSALETKLWYLFGGRTAAAGFIAPERAVTQVVDELKAHEQAMGEAVRLALEGVLHEFEPDAIKARLLGGGPRLFESARAWDAFVKEQGEHGREPGRRVQELLDRHFSRAYAQALLRAKRDTGASEGG